MLFLGGFLLCFDLHIKGNIGLHDILWCHVRLAEYRCIVKSPFREYQPPQRPVTFCPLLQLRRGQPFLESLPASLHGQKSQHR